jgi:myo-inositol 2-dehydrogenase/D-chiro-inositol 1-dehydrogenase
VHEIDLVRWLFDEEIVAASILKPRRTRRAAEALHDPLIVLLEMASGVLVDDEVFVNAGYGYDIRGEIVGETGAVALPPRICADWRERFAHAYDTELQDWLTAAAQGTAAGPSAWDGYAAAAVTDSALQALATGQRTQVNLPERPDLYLKAQ